MKGGISCYYILISQPNREQQDGQIPPLASKMYPSVDLNRLRIRGLETAVHKALIREILSSAVPARIIDLTACP